MATTLSAAMVSLADIREAQERVAPVIRKTPLLASDSLSAAVGRSLWCKGEHLQRTGSFKIRGAYNLISRLDPGVDVVAASAGNHAQGVALAASLTGRRSTIFMPVNAPLPKLEATRGYGAEVILTGSVVDECLEAAQAFAEERGAVFVPPFDDPLIVAGQGTIGLELAEEAPDAEVVVVPVGGGGLISGVAAALAYTRRSVRVVGVEPEGAASMAAAVAKSGPVMLDGVDTMADGVAVKSVTKLTLAHVQAYVDEIVTVTEEEISRALLLLLERQKALVEPAGATALAALMAGKISGTGPAVALLSGGNVDPLLLIRLIDHGLSVAGRYVMLRIILRDHPGALAGLTAAVAEMGLNVLDVEHHRAGVHVGVDQVEVLMTVETRDPEHRSDIVRRLGECGYRVELQA